MPPPPGPPFPPPTGEFSHHDANCHCGKVRYSFSISPPLEQYPAISCDCSICQRNGYLCVYTTKDRVKLQGDDSEANLGTYNFGKNVVNHNFCKNCGSSVFFEITASPFGPPPAAADPSAPKPPTLMGLNVSWNIHLE